MSTGLVKSVLFTLILLLVAGCSLVAEDAQRVEESTRSTAEPEATVVERTVYRTVMEAPEETTAESTIEEVNEELPNPLEENNFVNDSASLSADVPSVWSGRRTDEVWVFEGEAVGPGMTAATDLTGWEETGEATAGTYITASSTLASATDDEILDTKTASLSEICTVLERDDFESHGYTGRIQGGTNCEPAGKSLFNVVASKEGRECVVAVQVGYTTGEEKEQAQRVLDTFEADCAKVSDFEEGLEDYVVEEEPEQAISCGGFASQLAAQQYYDFNASPEEQALLDPDANGYACDVELLGYQIDAADPGIVPREGGGFDDYMPEVGDTCPPGYTPFGDPGTGQLSCVSPEEMESYE